MGVGWTRSPGDGRYGLPDVVEPCRETARIVSYELGRLTRRAVSLDSLYGLDVMRTHPRRRPRQGLTGPRKRWVAVTSLSRLGLASILIAVLLLTAGAQEERSRLIAIGDIHGAASSVRAVLQRAGLIDQQDHWIGGRATLVQTGDYTDRGPDVRIVMDLLMRLEDEADAAGGRVEVLLGNHETMNLTAEVRDVTPVIFASFADDGSAERREEAYQQYRTYVETRREWLGRPLPDSQTQEE